jgi:hypothetical protein
MNNKIIWIVTGLMAAALTLPAQQGRSGAPYAWNDKDKDGICDITGKPVGQGRGGANCPRQGMRNGRGRGRGMMQRGFRQQRNAPVKPQAPPAENTK